MTVNYIVTAFKRWYETRRAIAELRALPTYLLADMGIDRHQVPEVVTNLIDAKYSTQVKTTKPRVIEGRVALTGA